MVYTKKEFAEFVRLALISDIFSVDEAHVKLHTLVEADSDPDISLIDAVMSYEKDSITSNLARLKGEYNPLIIECLIASELLKRFDERQLNSQRLAFALYLQLIDKNTDCWQKDHNLIMKLDDGFKLADQGIGSEKELSNELVIFLQNKKTQCI